MKSLICGVSALALACVAAGAAAAQDLPARAAYAEPSLSPDGQTIAFVSGGDIWEVPAAGGTARLLVSDDATEGRPLYSPDGAKLTFTSTRDGGNANVYVLDLASGAVTRLTWAEGTEELNGWSPDGRWIYFATASHDISRFTDVFRVASTGGTPMQVTREPYSAEFQATAAPDGKRIALLARGSMASPQYWRNGHSNIDETELWVKDLASEGGYTQVVAPDAKQAWPMWSPDGASLTYMSDQSGVENLWQVPAGGGAPRQLTRFTDGRLLFPQMAANGSAIVFERDFAIWRYDPASGEAGPVDIALRGAPAGEQGGHRAFGEFTQLAVAPDGKKLAVIAHGELFALPSKEGVPRQLTRTQGSEGSPTWSPDSARLLYTGQRGTEQWLFEYDVAAGRETALTRAGIASSPSYSPNGDLAVYVRDLREVRVVSLPRDGRAASERVLFTGTVDPTWVPPPVFSPDGRYVAFVTIDAKSFANVHVVPTAGGAARPVSFLANGQVAGLAWSPDGKYILFDTGQRNERQQIVRIDLTPHVPSYREDVFADLFKTDAAPGNPDKPEEGTDKPAKEAAPAKKPAPVEIVWDGLRDRATIVPIGVEGVRPLISPDGKTLIFNAIDRRQDNLYSYSLDELASEPAVAKQLTATPRPKGDFALTADGKTLYYLDGGRIFSTPLDNPKPAAVPASVEMEIDFGAEKQVVFDQAWTLLNAYFHDPEFNGADWDALRRHYQPLVAGAKTSDEMRRAIGLMIGELNASHLGIGKPGAAQANRVGNLGLAFDRAAYEAGRGLVVRDLVKLGPADISGVIAPGDRLVSVNGTDIGPRGNADRLLENTVGKQTRLGIVGSDGARRTVTVQPVSNSTATGLRYRHWIGERRALVERLSGGRLGYVHMPDMTAESLDQLYLDLDAANQARQGVVVDVRNNNGGFVNGFALDVISRHNYMMMTPRGLPPLPARQALGQRALGLPTVLLTNENTLSDGEDFSAGYRALNLGKIVGQPTAGWIIYTSNLPLIDGSVVRVPSVRIHGTDDEDWEMNPRPVDVAVEQPLGDGVRGEDSQLSAAVRILLDQLGAT